ncbi:hypothetical protein BYT27DRAFT_7193094, partial [Phlegmacium glaucopus]
IPGWRLWSPALQNRFSGAMERIDPSKSAIIRTLSSRSTHLDEEILCYLSSFEFEHAKILAICCNFCHVIYVTRHNI